MASISAKNSEYAEGHTVQLRNESRGVSVDLLNQLRKCKYQFGKSKFSIIRRVPKQYKISNIIQVTEDGKIELVLKDSNGKYAMFTGSESAIDALFVHSGKGDSVKADTTVKTEIKELISMWVFESMIESGIIPSEDLLMSKLSLQKRKSYSSVYYKSAIKQAEVLKGETKGRGYTYERQRDNLTGRLYELGRSLSHKTNDNWNPADIWLIKRASDITELLKSETINELNDGIAAGIKSRDILPISLKQVENATANFAIIDPESAISADPAGKMDFSFKRVDLSNSFNNFILWTQSGFGIRVGYKSKASNFNVFLEGRMEGATSQLGAVDKKAFVTKISTDYRYKLRFSENAPPDAELQIAKLELSEIFKRQSRISVNLGDEKNTLEILKASPKFVQQRFSNIMSFMYAMLVKPSSPKEFASLLKYCYYSAKKMTGGSSSYILIS
jgi:hypothetical protein